MSRFAHLAKTVWKGRLDVVRQAVEDRADLTASTYDTRQCCWRGETIIR